MQEPLGQKQAGQDPARTSWLLKTQKSENETEISRSPPDVLDLKHTCSHGDAGCAPHALGRRPELPLSLEQHLDLEETQTEPE